MLFILNCTKNHPIIYINLDPNWQAQTFPDIIMNIMSNFVPSPKNFVSSPNRIPIGARLKYIQEGVNNKSNFKEILLNKITAAIREL